MLSTKKAAKPRNRGASSILWLDWRLAGVFAGQKVGAKAKIKETREQSRTGYCTRAVTAAEDCGAQRSWRGYTKLVRYQVPMS